MSLLLSLSALLGAVAAGFVLSDLRHRREALRAIDKDREALRALSAVHNTHVAAMQAFEDRIAAVEMRAGQATRK